MCLKYRKSKTSEILEISRNKCTLKIGCVLLSLQVARCLSSGEQRHNHPLDRHHHRRHISVEEDLKSTPTSSPTSSPSSATWTPSSTSPKTRWLFLEFCDSLRVRVILCHPNNPQGFPSTHLLPMHALLSPHEAMINLAVSSKVTLSFRSTLFLSSSSLSSSEHPLSSRSYQEWDIAIFVRGCR